MIPLLIVRKIIESTIELMEIEYNSKDLETDSFLYRVFEESEIDGYNLFEQAKEVFFRGDNSSRKIKVNLQFDRSMIGTPSVMLRVPADRKNNNNGIGMGYGSNDFYTNDDGSTTDKLNYSRVSNFELMITGTNQNECLMIYETLFNALFMVSDTFSQAFELFEFNGKEVFFNEEILAGVFSKVIELKIDYRREVPRIMTQEFLSKVVFENPTLLNFKTT